MNRIKWGAMALLVSVSLFAQNNDTALYRELGVIAVEKYVFVHAFSDNHDTCLYSRQELDDQQRSTYEKVNMGCFGFKELDEMFYTYDSLGLKEMKLNKIDGPFSVSSYEFNEKGQPTRIVTSQLRTNDSIINLFEYYNGKYQSPDSSVMLKVDEMGDTSLVKTIARFNNRGEAVTVISMDEDRKLLQEVTYEFKDSGVISSTASSSFGDRPFFSQTFYEHDQFNRVVISYNNINQRQEFYYLKNGLLSNILSYNPKGDLESELIYKYEFK